MSSDVANFSIRNVELNSDLIRGLPKQFLLQLSASQLHKFWKDVPTKLKEDEEVLERLPCLEHYNRPDDCIHIDGPAPPKFRCYACKRLKSQIRSN